VKVGASTTPATYYLPPFLARFHEEHPAVELTITVGDTREILDALEEGRIEMAVVGDEVDKHRYHAKKVASDRIVLAVGRGHPWFGRHKVKLDELRGQALIVRGEGSATLASVDQALEGVGLHIGREVPIALRLPTNEAIREAVARGKAAAFLPKTVLAGRDGEVRALDIEGMTIERPFTLVLSLSREPGPAAKSLMQMLG
jgi:DNA-binding transcriptional LysR family regulator